MWPRRRGEAWRRWLKGGARGGEERCRRQGGDRALCHGEVRSLLLLSGEVKVPDVVVMLCCPTRKKRWTSFGDDGEVLDGAEEIEREA